MSPADQARADYVRRTVAAFPPLSPDQLARVAALLAPSGGASK